LVCTAGREDAAHHLGAAHDESVKAVAVELRHAAFHHCRRATFDGLAGDQTGVAPYFAAGEPLSGGFHAAFEDHQHRRVRLTLNADRLAREQRAFAHRTAHLQQVLVRDFLEKVDGPYQLGDAHGIR
jgi:hypothetical protein